MAEEQKKDPVGFQKFCQGTPFGDMMKKMMEAEKGALPGRCAEMMARMKKMCCGAGEKQEAAPSGAKENPPSRA